MAPATAQIDRTRRGPQPLIDGWPDRLVAPDGHNCVIGLQVLFLVRAAQVPGLSRAERRERQTLARPLGKLLIEHGESGTSEADFRRKVAELLREWAA